MKRFRNHAIAIAVFAALAVIGTVMNSRQATAQGPPDGLAVRIVSPLPVPVTGSTTVSGTVAATQSGPWNVGITGQPIGVHGSIFSPDEPTRAPYDLHFDLLGNQCNPNCFV